MSRAWDKEKILSPAWGIEPQTFAFRGSMLYHWVTKDSTVSDIYDEVHMTSITKFIFENPTYIQWKALKQLEHSPRKKDTFNVYTFKGLQFIFYKDEFKVWLKIRGEMCLPLVA